MVTPSAFFTSMSWAKAFAPTMLISTVSRNVSLICFIISNVSSTKYNCLKIWWLAKDKVTELFRIADDFCKFFDAMMAKYAIKETKAWQLGQKTPHFFSPLQETEMEERIVPPLVHLSQSQLLLTTRRSCRCGHFLSFGGTPASLLRPTFQRKHSNDVRRFRWTFRRLLPCLLPYLYVCTFVLSFGRWRS